MMKITDEELATLPSKALRDPEVVEFYRDHEFLDAYAMHTDKRVREDPKGAIGAPEHWERHGDLQFKFLRDNMLQPTDRFLEIGCGTGRLARKVIPYLNDWRYTGTDISPMALNAAMDLGRQEKWIEKHPTFLCRSLAPKGSFEVIFSFSVTIHLPQVLLLALFKSIAMTMHRQSVFYFSYVFEVEDKRTGLKQFRHTEKTYKETLDAANLEMVEASNWDAEQRMAQARFMYWRK